MLIMLTLAAASLATCRVESARYAMRTAPGITAYFKRVNSGPDWPNGLALATHFAATGRTYWWLPWNGGTDDLQNVSSTTDVTVAGWKPPSPDGGPRPLGDLEYLATDAGYKVIDAVPERGDIAPAHILLTHLGDRVWHGPNVNARDSAPKQFFDLVACSRTARGDRR